MAQKIQKGAEMSEEYKYPPRMVWADEIKELKIRIAELEAENLELRKPVVIWGEKLRQPPEE